MLLNMLVIMMHAVGDSALACSELSTGDCSAAGYSVKQSKLPSKLCA